MQTKYSAEVSIKISALSDRLRVVVSVATDTQHIISGKSVEFMTHNNGKVPKDAEVPNESPKRLAGAKRERPAATLPPTPAADPRTPHGQPPHHHPYDGGGVVSDPDVLMVHNSGHQGPVFRPDQRQPFHTRYLGPQVGVGGGGDGGGGGGGGGGVNGGVKSGGDNMTLLYSKLMAESAGMPESPPHPAVGDCSSPEHGDLDDEPPLSQMKKRKYLPTPPRLQSPPPQQPLPPHPHALAHPLAHPQMMPQYAAQQSRLMPLHHPPPQLQHPPPLHYQQPPPTQLYRELTDSSGSHSSECESLREDDWHGLSPQSTPEEEFEMQEMARAVDGGSSGLGSEEDYTSPHTQIPQPGMGGGGVGGPMKSPRVIDGDLHVKGAVRARAYMQYSDIRLKTDIEEIVDAIDLISKLEGKRYRWKPDAFRDSEANTLDSLPNGDVDEQSSTSSVDGSYGDDDDDEDDVESGVLPLLDGHLKVWKKFGFSANETLEEDHEERGQRVIGLIAQEVHPLSPLHPYLTLAHSPSYIGTTRVA